MKTQSLRVLLLLALASCAAPRPQAPVAVVDPKSVEAAAVIVRSYAALIERGEYGRAAAYWGSAANATDFARQLKGRPTRIQVGAAEPAEGAAGSIYTRVLVTVSWQGFSRPAHVVLRRVNDVPGSAEAQRRWHIERIAWLSRS